MTGEGGVEGKYTPKFAPLRSLDYNDSSGAYLSSAAPITKCMNSV
jgi:hypothetical protein